MSSPSMNATVELMPSHDCNPTTEHCIVHAELDVHYAAEGTNVADGCTLGYYQDSDASLNTEGVGGSEAVELPSFIQSTHQWLPQLMTKLADALRECAQRDDQQLLDDVVSGYFDAEMHYAAGQPEWMELQMNHAIALCRRFERRGREQDLDEAIKRMEGVRLRMTEGHPDYWRLFNNLGNALTTRFEVRGCQEDLNQAIRYLGDALLAVPAGDFDRCLSLNNLGGALWTRFEQQGDAADLDKAIQRLNEALLLTPTGHPSRWVSLNNVATALSTRFEVQGDENDLNEAIRYHREVLLLRPMGCPNNSMHLGNLATALKIRFNLRRDENDLEEAIQCHRDALLLRPTGHPQRSESLSNLAGALRTRFEERGDMDDLDEAIQYHHDVLSLTPPGHPHRSTSLSSLATSLSVRFGRRGDLNDLDQALQYYRDVLLLRPVGHPNRSGTLSNLAVALSRMPTWRALDEAIQYHSEALSLKPSGHPDCSRLLTNLAIAIGERFCSRGDWNDLGKAIQLHRDALLLDPGRATTLTALALILGKRFERQGDRKDVDEALQLCRVAKAETLLSHPLQLPIHRAFGNLHLALWEALRIDVHLQSAIDHYKVATDVEPAGPLARLESCLAWVRNGENHVHDSTLEAYRRSLQLLDVHVSAASSISARYQTMKHFPVSLAVDAASCALRRGDVTHGLELLEQGRVLLWNQMIRFRTSLDDLSSRDRHAEGLVKRFREISFLLGRQPTDKISSGDTLTATAEAEARRHRHLVDDWNKVVAEIRTLDGFSRFLLPPLFSDLREAACKGPVIVLVASKFSCDAIIVLHNQPPVHIVLSTSLQKLEALADRLRKQTFLAPEPNKNVIIEVLRELWASVVGAVISRLEQLVEKGSRIWWCPTSVFTLFPLHAAGAYHKGATRSVTQLYVSSYTPSLSALIKARKGKHTSSLAHFAAVGQALPAGYRIPLELVDSELDKIESLLPSSASVFTKLGSSLSTKDEALRALRDNPWVHFSCHGTQDFKEPFKSRLAMRDGPLSLLDIINTDLSNHEFAFLSACKTAVGDWDTPDEAIHLAAGLQFMGVKSVIGTLWRVDDAVTHNLVSKFYKEFCAGDKMDCTRAARALRKAFILLAQEKVPLEDRIMFIHIGI